MDEDGHERRGDAHGPGRLGMVEIGEVAKRQRALIPRVDLIESGSERNGSVGLVDRVDVVDRDPIVETIRGSLGLLAPTPSQPPMVISQLVGRDPEDPRPETSRAPPEPRQPPEGSLEGGSSDIVGDLPRARPSIGEAMDSFDVTTVELGERLDVGTRPLDEVALVERVVLR